MFEVFILKLLFVFFCVTWRLSCTKLKKPHRDNNALRHTMANTHILLFTGETSPTVDLSFPIFLLPFLSTFVVISRYHLSALHFLILFSRVLLSSKLQNSVIAKKVASVAYHGYYSDSLLIKLFNDKIILTYSTCKLVDQMKIAALIWWCI